MGALDPAEHFRDDHGTPHWRRQHAVIGVFPSRWAAVKAHLKRNPWTIFCLFVVASLIPYIVFFGGLTLLTIWYSIFS
jgi:hypothetical protein